ncbi:hypothetical protein M885DRAFT_525930 [Pelagophyceae sp. CCMP2097]|nr:hypothetical protein M885DRAFT_525930 [Pelagophyceae sp. CCMP2097]
MSPARARHRSVRRGAGPNARGAQRRKDRMARGASRKGAKGQRVAQSQKRNPRLPRRSPRPATRTRTRMVWF